MTRERSHDPLRRSIAEALAPGLERRADGEGHPSLDDLLRHHAGELDAAAAERLLNHLEVCAECVQDLLDLDRFVAAGAARVEDAGVEEAVPGEVPPGEARLEKAAPAIPAGRRGGLRRRSVLALAASLLVAVATLAAWLVHVRGVAGDLRRQVAELSAPRPDAPIVDLRPDSSARGAAADAGTEAPVQVPAGEGAVTLVLNLPRDTEAGAAFTAELVDADGRVRWRGTLHASRFGTFTLGLSRRSLSPGENRIRLFRGGGNGGNGGESGESGERRPVEIYRFEVGAPEEP